MAEIISLHKHYVEKQCRFAPLQTLFNEHDVVLVGDELGAFYLDKNVFPTEETEECSNDNDAFHLWDKRDRYEAKVSYMELVYAAYESGVRDIVVDMVPAMQEGLNEALKTYQETSQQLTMEILFRALLINGHASPMDAVVQMAGALGMKVHALNAGLTGVATLFRKAKGTKDVPQHLSYEEKVKRYRKHGFEKDKQTLRQIVRRRLTDEEADTLRQYMELRLSDKKEAFEEKVFDESPTHQSIKAALGNKPFLGFFQNDRILESAEDLDGKLRRSYGENNVARLSLTPDNNHPKQPQYRFRYSRKNCAVAMTEDYVKTRRDDNRQACGPEKISDVNNRLLFLR